VSMEREHWTEVRYKTRGIVYADGRYVMSPLSAFVAEASTFQASAVAATMAHAEVAGRAYRTLRWKAEVPI
jgi:hypothetical protein